MNLTWKRKTGFWLILCVLCGPLACLAAEMQAGDWALNVGGTLRMSYNQEDCDGTCQDIWRTTNTDTTAYEDADTYLTGDISTVSVSGSRKMDSGMNALFKSEWRIDTPEGDDETILSNYEQYLGLDGTWSLLRAGTVETPYMQTGKLLDPFWSDALSTRFFVDIQSALHHNTGKGRGRSTHTLRFDSPISKSGVTAQLFMAVDNSGDADNAYGGGFIYTAQSMTLFLQYYDNGEAGDDEATKIGAKLGSNAFSIFGQYEFDQGLISLSEGLSSLKNDDVDTAAGDNLFEHNETTGADVWFLGASYKAGKITLLYEYGERKNSNQGDEEKDGHTGWIAGLRLELDKYLYCYMGYLEKTYNNEELDKDTRYTFGAALSF